MRILLLGCGGAGRTVAITSAMRGASEVVLADVDVQRSAALAVEIEQLGCAADISGISNDKSEWEAAASQSHLIVQATPVGMNPEDPSLLDAKVFHGGQYVLDLIYMYPATPIMKAAAQSGAKTANGIGMLLHQGAHAFTIWTGRQADTDAMRGALEQAVYG